MKKFAVIVLTVLMACLFLVGCGKAAPSGGSVYTGVLEEKKDFMIIVTAEDGSESYIFNLGDGTTCEAEVGDTVEVTYTGELNNIDASPIATAITKKG